MYLLMFMCSLSNLNIDSNGVAGRKVAIEKEVKIDIESCYFIIILVRVGSMIIKNKME